MNILNMQTMYAQTIFVFEQFPRKYLRPTPTNYYYTAERVPGFVYY